MEDLIQLDDGVIFDFFTGGDTAHRTELILHEAKAVLSAITVFELFAGVRDEKHIQQRQEFVQLCEIIDLNTGIMRKAAELYTGLKQSGRLIPNEDIFIAACGIYNNYPLFTLNRKHFERIPDLILF